MTAFRSRVATKTILSANTGKKKKKDYYLYLTGKFVDLGLNKRKS